MKVMDIYKDLLKTEIKNLTKVEIETYVVNNPSYFKKGMIKLFKKIPSLKIKILIPNVLKTIKNHKAVYKNNTFYEVPMFYKKWGLEFLEYCIINNPEVDFNLFDSRDKKEIERFIKNKFLISMYDSIPKDKLFNMKEYTEYKHRYNSRYNMIKSKKDYFILEGFKSKNYQFEVNLFYHKYGLNYFKNKPKTGTILDVGAFIGDSAYLFAKNTNCKIMALEPDNKNYNDCLRNIKFNDLSKRVDVLNVALGLNNTKADSNLTGGLGTYLNYSSNGKIKIITLDTLIKSQKINDLELIKMDIEGFELDALKGGINTIKKYKPKLIICLYHKGHDLFEIPKLLNKWVPTYHFRFVNLYKTDPLAERVLIAENK